MVSCNLEVLISTLDTAVTAGNALHRRHVILAIGLLVLQALITAFEVTAGLPIFMEFKNHAQTFDNVTARSDLWNRCYTIWGLFFVASWFVAFSQLILAVFCVVQFCQCVKTQCSMEASIICWLRINFVAEFIIGDVMVSIAKIFMALESEEDLLELQTKAGQTSSMVTFVATVIRCLIVSVTLARPQKDPMQLIYDSFCLLAGFMALSTTTFSMLISWSLYVVHPGDTVSLAVIGVWLIGSVFVGCVGWCLLLILIFYIKCKCKPRGNRSPRVTEGDNDDEEHTEIDEHRGIRTYIFAIVVLLLYAAITTSESSAGLPIVMEYPENNDESEMYNLLPNGTIIINTTILLQQKYFGFWISVYAFSWLSAAVELVAAIFMVSSVQYPACGFEFDVSRMNILFIYDLIIGAVVSIPKILLAHLSEKALQKLQTEAGQISSMATFVGTLIRLVILNITLLIICVRGRYNSNGFVVNLLSSILGFLALSPVIFSMLVSWSWYVVYPGDTGNRGVTIGRVIGFMICGGVCWMVLLLVTYCTCKHIHNSALADHVSPEGLNRQERITGNVEDDPSTLTHRSPFLEQSLQHTA